MIRLDSISSAPSLAQSEPLRDMLTTFVLLARDDPTEGDIETISRIMNALGPLTFNNPISIASRAQLYVLKPDFATRLLEWLERLAIPALKGFQSNETVYCPVST
jgi:hypothetical protein